MGDGWVHSFLSWHPDKLPLPGLPLHPQVGTANYAFLISMYISEKQGTEFLSKDGLMSKVWGG